MMTVTGEASSGNSQSEIAGGTEPITIKPGKGGIKLKQRTRYISLSCCVFISIASVLNMRLRYTMILVATSPYFSLILTDCKCELMNHNSELAIGA